MSKMFAYYLKCVIIKIVINLTVMGGKESSLKVSGLTSATN